MYVVMTTWVSECFGWYLMRLPNFPFCQQKLQNLKGLFPQIYCPAIYSEKQRRYSDGRERRNCSEISRDTQCKTSSRRFQKEAWHVESRSDQTRHQRCELQQTESEKQKSTSRNPLKKMRGMNCLWSVESQQKRQIQICHRVEDWTVTLTKKKNNHSASFYPPKTSL